LAKPAGAMTDFLNFYPDGCLAKADISISPRRPKLYNRDMKLKGDYRGIPYDFSIPTLRKFRSRWWNEDDPRVIVPKAFGLGFDINLYQLKHRYPRLFIMLAAGAAATVIVRLIGADDDEEES